MADDARQLHDFNARIRDAATQGKAEDMIMLIEKRRQFLDALPTTAEGRSSALIAALDEAVRDNHDLVRGLEGAMEQARSRGKTTLQARRRYHKTQTNP
jgi:hypothetical protein